MAELWHCTHVRLLSWWTMDSQVLKGGSREGYRDPVLKFVRAMYNKGYIRGVRFSFPLFVFVFYGACSINFMYSPDCEYIFPCPNTWILKANKCETREASWVKLQGTWEHRDMREYTDRGIAVFSYYPRESAYCVSPSRDKCRPDRRIHNVGQSVTIGGYCRSGRPIAWPTKINMCVLKMNNEHLTLTAH